MMAKKPGLGGGAPSRAFLFLHFRGSHSGAWPSSVSVCYIRTIRYYIFGSSSAGSIFIIICVAGYLSLVDILIYMVNYVTISIRDCQMRRKNEMSALFVYELWGYVHV